MVKRGKLALALAAILMAPPAYAAKIKDILIESAGANVRMTIKLSGPFDAPSGFALDTPQRLVIDLPGNKTGNHNVPGQGAVKAARAAQFTDKAARVVVDLASPMTFGDVVMRGADSSLVVTLKPSDDISFKALVSRGRSKLLGTTTHQIAKAETPVEHSRPQKSISQGAPTSATRTPPPLARSAVAMPPARSAGGGVKQPNARPRDDARPLVVIDAGHGGKDIGALSVYQSQREKDATLAIAKAIKRELEASGHVRVLLTRADDRFIPLRQRVEIARAAKANLFISIHADSAAQPDVRGATVYTLSEVASDKEAARLAAKENKSDIIAGVNFAAETPDVTDILIDLAQRETMNMSAVFAATLRREMSTEVHFKSNAHRFAGFMVLKAADVPSVLIETGYLSNLEDSKFLFSAVGQRAIAQGVRRAVEAHLLRRVAQR